MKHLESYEKMMEMCQEGVGGLCFKRRGSFFGWKQILQPLCEKANIQVCLLVQVPICYSS